MHVVTLGVGKVRLWATCVLFLLSFSGVAEDDINKLLDERMGGEAQPEVLQEQQAIAKAKQLALLDKGGAILEQVDALTAEISSWNQKTQDLLNNEQGKAIAGDEKLVEAFSILHEKERVSQNEVTTIKNRVLNLLAPVQSAKSEQSMYVPSNDLINQITSEENTLSEAISDYQKAQEQLNALVIQAKGNKAADSTLAVAIANLKTRHAEQETNADLSRQERLRAEIEKAKNERVERLAKIEAELIQKNTEQEEKLLRERAEQERQLRAEEAEYEVLKKRAESKVIQRKYAPFVNKGKNILSKNGKWETAETPISLSVTGLMKMYAMSDAKRFIQVATTNENDRPKWKRPVTKEDKNEITKRLKEFNELAPIWVEMGLLNP